MNARGAILAMGLAAASSFADEFPVVDGKKGLQVQMTADAIALGIRHATLNLRVDALIDPQPQPDSLVWKGRGGDLHFRRAAVEAFDRQVRPLSDAGIVVYAILLTGPGPLGHPKADPDPPNDLVAFDTVTPEGAARFRGCMEFIADRWSKPPYAGGRIAGYIVGNEVNSHHWWYNMGPATIDEVAVEYERAVRIVHESVRRSSPSARVYLSLEHHWSISFHPDVRKACPGRALLDAFAVIARRNGDFDWHLAYHPYPENLFEPRSWLDQQALPDAATPKITFKNLEVLRDYLRRPEMLCNGKPRSIILSEQGFHAAEGEAGEANQAAGFAFAWGRVDALDGIDAFILHRHVDHAKEGGLNLGLWTRKPGSVCEPDRRRPLHDLFKAAGTPAWFQFETHALPLQDIKEFTPVKVPATGVDWKMAIELNECGAAPPDFADRYTVVVAGCGTGCMEFCLVDRTTGLVLPGFECTTNPPPDYAGPLGFVHRRESRLFKVYSSERFAYPVRVDSYLWTGDRFSRIGTEWIRSEGGAPGPDR